MKLERRGRALARRPVTQPLARPVDHPCGPRILISASGAAGLLPVAAHFEDVPATRHFTPAPAVVPGLVDKQPGASSPSAPAQPLELRRREPAHRRFDSTL